MVGGTQVSGVGGRRRVREQIRRATGGLGRSVHAQRSGFDIARFAVGSQEETVESRRRPKRKTREPNGQRIQTRTSLNT